MWRQRTTTVKAAGGWLAQGQLQSPRGTLQCHWKEDGHAVAGLVESDGVVLHIYPIRGWSLRGGCLSCRNGAQLAIVCPAEGGGGNIPGEGALIAVYPAEGGRT